MGQIGSMEMREGTHLGEEYDNNEEDEDRKDSEEPEDRPEAIRASIEALQDRRDQRTCTHMPIPKVHQAQVQPYSPTCVPHISTPPPAPQSTQYSHRTERESTHEPTSFRR